MRVLFRAIRFSLTTPRVEQENVPDRCRLTEGGRGGRTEPQQVAPFGRKGGSLFAERWLRYIGTVALFDRSTQQKKKSTDSVHTSRARKYFGAEEFSLDEATDTLVCPAGKRLSCHCPNFQSGPKGYRGRSYMARAEDCAGCELRGRCIRKATTKARQVAKLQKGLRHGKKSFTQQMIERFDTIRGRYFYSRRLGTVEPVFANIRATLGMDRFTLRGTKKVDIQWKLFCVVHNIGKIRRFAKRKRSARQGS
jgi:hypothetical protein